MVQYASAVEDVDDGARDEAGAGDGYGASASATRAGEEDDGASASLAAAVIGFSPDDNSYYDFRGQRQVRTDDGDRSQSETLKGVFLRGVRLVALVLEWLDARVADILLSPAGITTTSATTRMSETPTRPVSEMVGGGSSSNNSGSVSGSSGGASSVADVGTNVVVELVDWFDHQISSLFGGSTSAGSGSTGSTSIGGGVGDSASSSDSSSSGQNRHNATPAPAPALSAPSPLGAGLVASLVESVLLGLGACVRAHTSSQHNP